MAPHRDIRLATERDLLRITYVAAAGFSRNEVFKFERPYYQSYPGDTLKSYHNSFLDSLRDRSCVVVVVTTDLDKNEDDKVEAVISQHAIQPSHPRSTVVGVASWRLQVGSRYSRFAQLQSEGLPDISMITSGKRLTVKSKHPH